MEANPCTKHGSLPHEAQLIVHETFLCTGKATYLSVVEDKTNTYHASSTSEKGK